MSSGDDEARNADEDRSGLLNARRDAVVLAVLISAVLLLIWNGSAFFNDLRFAGARFDEEVRVASTALTLNVALILFGWRRYVDLQHEAEMRADGERRAAVLASTDAITGLNNRKGFADRAAELSQKAAKRGDNLTILSIQIHRFKAVNDQHGYEIGDQLLRCLATAFTTEAGAESVIARLSGDEFAVAMAVAPAELGHSEEVAEAVLRAVTRPFMIEERMVQVGAFAGLATVPAADARISQLLRRADIAMDHAKSGRVGRPVWFDGGMERALIAHGEIEQASASASSTASSSPISSRRLIFRRATSSASKCSRGGTIPCRGSSGPTSSFPLPRKSASSTDCPSR